MTTTTTRPATQLVAPAIVATRRFARPGEPVAVVVEYADGTTALVPTPEG